MATRRRLIIVAAALTVSVAAILTAGGAPAPQVSEADAVSTTVDADTAFACDLYQVLLRDNADQNLFLSPYSISTILGLTAAGARGATADQMKRLLHISNLETIQTGNSGISRQLTDTQNDQRPYQLFVANALWEDKRYPMLPDFQALAEKYYDTSGAFTVDFLTNHEAERVHINKWVEDQTKTKIKDLIPSNAIDQHTALVLTNAIYFKGAWEDQFEPELTRAQPFHVGARKDVQVALMDSGGSRLYFENDDLQIVSLPYKAAPSSSGSPEIVSMLIVLPKKTDGLAEVEKSLTPENLNKWIASLRWRTGEVLLPKFTITFPTDLRSVLMSMGMTDAFNLKTADFRALATPPPHQNIYISNVFHKAFVDVNEEGTEAAAATAVEGAVGSMAPANPFRFRADHPFFFAIRYEPTNSILFMGHVIEPPPPVPVAASEITPAMQAGPVRLVAQQSGKCLEAIGAPSQLVAAMQQTCDDASAQQWSFHTVVGGYQIVSALDPHLCLNLRGATTAQGARVWLSACSEAGTAGEIWNLEAAGNGYNLIASHSAKCMDVSRGSTADGSAILQYTCHGSRNQIWTMPATVSPAEQTPSPALPQQQAPIDVVSRAEAILRNLPTHVPELAVAQARTYRGDVEVFYIPADEPNDGRNPKFVLITISSYDSEEEAKRGLELSLRFTQVTPTQKQTYKGSTLYKWDQWGGDRILSQVGQYVVNIEALRPPAQPVIVKAFDSLVQELGTGTLALRQQPPATAVQVPDIKITFAHPPDAPPPFGGGLPPEALSPPGMDSQGRGAFSDIVANRVFALNVTWSDPGRFKSEAQTEDLLTHLLGAKIQAYRYKVWSEGNGVPSLVVTVEHVSGNQGKWVIWCQPGTIYWAYEDSNGKWWWCRWTALEAALPNSLDAQTDDHAWGDSVDGVQLRLAISENPPSRFPPQLPGDLPYLEMQIRNTGTDPVTFSCHVEEAAQIQIDGIWLDPGGYAETASCASSPALGPGTQGAKVPLLSNVIVGRKIVSVDQLNLTPGRHSIRVRTPSGEDGVWSGSTFITLLSNAITVEIPALSSAAETQMLIERASIGGNKGLPAARRLVEKCPDAALDAIEAAVRATPDAGTRSQYVDLAGTLPGDTPLAFLRSQLVPEAGLLPQVHAATALLARGQPDVVPVMIDAWRTIQPHLLANESDAYFEAGYLITFLAKSGDARAIAVLAQNIPGEPVGVRLATVQVFLPWPKIAGQSGKGPGIYVNGDMANLPAGEAGATIERLLIAALDDRGQRVGLKGTYNEISYEDPRVCDMAALVLSKRWPEEYRFTWPASLDERDAQIAAIRNTWRQR